MDHRRNRCNVISGNPTFNERVTIYFDRALRFEDTIFIDGSPTFNAPVDIKIGEVGKNVKIDVGGSNFIFENRNHVTGPQSMADEQELRFHEAANQEDDEKSSMKETWLSDNGGFAVPVSPKFNRILKNEAAAPLTQAKLTPATGPAVQSGTEDESFEDVRLGISTDDIIPSHLRLLYPIKSSPKGRALIVNNKDFSHSSPRRGSSIDLERMKELWTKMGCKNTVKENLTAKELIQNVKMFSDSMEKVDFYVVVIMSHGREDDLVVGNREGEDAVQTILNIVLESEAMKGKPKLIFFQMCRGSNIWQNNTQQDAAPGHSARSDNDWIKYLLNKVLDGGRELGNGHTEVDIPAGEYLGTTPDLLLAFATQPDHVSYRDPLDGSWFIKCIYNVFMQHAATHDVRTLMQMVKEELSQQRGYAPGTDIHEKGVKLDGKDTFGKKILRLIPNAN